MFKIYLGQYKKLQRIYDRPHPKGRGHIKAKDYIIYSGRVKWKRYGTKHVGQLVIYFYNNYVIFMHTKGRYFLCLYCGGQFYHTFIINTNLYKK